MAIPRIEILLLADRSLGVPPALDGLRRQLDLDSRTADCPIVAVGISTASIMVQARNAREIQAIKCMLEGLDGWSTMERTAYRLP